MVSGRGSVFVVGTGRCGSTLLSELLRDHSRGLSLSELFTVLGGPAVLAERPMTGPELWHLLSEPSADLAAFSELSDQIDEIPWTSGELAGRAPIAPLLLIPFSRLCQEPARLYAESSAFIKGLPLLPVEDALSAFFDWLCERQGKSYWLERSGGSLEYLPALLRAWPHARFIHIYRDGPSCARSMARHPFFRVRVARILTKRADLPIAAALAQQIPIDRFGAYWSLTVTRGIKALASLTPRRVLHVRFNDLLESPDAEFERVLRFLNDLPAKGLDGVARQIRRRTVVHELPPASELAALERACQLGTRSLVECGLRA